MAICLLWRVVSGYNSFMTTASISQAKNHLSALLDRVKRGETVLILDRQSPVATLCPINGSGGGSGEAYLQMLARQGLVRLPARKADKKVLDMPLPRTEHGASVLEALLEERRDGR